MKKKLLLNIVYVFLVLFGSKVIIFLKEILIAKEFGASWELDCFLAAFIFNSVITTIFIGAYSASVIPAYIEVREKLGISQSNKYFSSIIWIGAFIVFLINILVWLTSKQSIPLLFGNFKPSQIQLSQSLLSILLFYQMFFYFASIFATFLNSLGKNSYQAAILGFPALFIILFLIIADSNIYMLAAGSLLGAFISAIFYFYAALRSGLRIFFHIEWNSFIINTLIEWFPLILAQMLVSVNLIVDRAMASNFGEGGLSLLDFGTKVYGVASSICISIISIVFLPRFSSLVAKKDYVLLYQELKKIVFYVLITGVPFTIIVVYFDGLIVKLLFERGAFTSSDTHSVSQIFSLYMLGFLFNLLGILGVKLITALQQNRYMFLLGILSASSNIIFNIWFTKFMGIKGIALSTSVVYVLTFIGIVLAVNKEFRRKYILNV